MVGTIKAVVADRGFGFIKGTDEIEYFFHINGCTMDFASLRAGDQVSFDLKPDPRRAGSWRACHIAWCDEAAA
jgi:cold shock CspA family protein